VGDAFRKRRLELGIHQAGVADQIGCDKNSVTNREKNYTASRINHMAASPGYDPMPKCDNMAQRIVNHRDASRDDSRDIRRQDRRQSEHARPVGAWGEAEPNGRFIALFAGALGRETHAR
jgi:transcriptional regulator with XRE-family HTH domain